MRSICVAGLFCLILAACSAVPEQQLCGPGDLARYCPPAHAIDDAFTADVHKKRTWRASEDLPMDLIELGKTADIPVQQALGKIIGPSTADAQRSLAAKLAMIEAADHTIDFFYYILRDDAVGMAMLGALCEAVKRGVDVRILVDAVGSTSLPKQTLRAIVGCQEQAGFMRTADGQLTTNRARIQAVAFNAVSNFSANFNRRSHDKLLVTDGRYPSKAMVMTGGRNIALDYYGVSNEGELDLDAYRDTEILLRDAPEGDPELTQVGEMSGRYASVVFLFKGNNVLRPGRGKRTLKTYDTVRQQALETLQRVKSWPILAEEMSSMDAYMSEGFHPAKVRLAHELGNLTDSKVFVNQVENERGNSNSILEVMRQINRHSDHNTTLSFVSPYLFLAEYDETDQAAAVDEAQQILNWLDRYPEARFELVTNSALTSDNFIAQAVIDMNTVPRLLLDEAMIERWKNTKENHAPEAFLSSEAWQRMVNHPQISIYELGRSDSRYFGGYETYGKMHAKFYINGDVGFVGTSNFDYRSRLLNNEVGFFFESPQLIAELQAGYDLLVEQSYQWGSPQWLEMRRQIIAQGGSKGRTTKFQRAIYKWSKWLGLIWQF